MLPDILEMLLDIPDRISGKVCSELVARNGMVYHHNLNKCQCSAWRYLPRPVTCHSLHILCAHKSERYPSSPI
jgi:hypothetical protein